VKLYAWILLFFLNSSNGMFCIKMYGYISCWNKKVKTIWSVSGNSVCFSLCRLKNDIPLITLNATLLSYDNELTGEIRIDSIQKNASLEGAFISDAPTYVVRKFIKSARKKKFNLIGYHDFSGEDVHSAIHLALLVNDFTKKLIRSSLGNKRDLDLPVEHYFYEKQL